MHVTNIMSDRRQLQLGNLTHSSSMSELGIYTKLLADHIAPLVAKFSIVARAPSAVLRWF